MVITVCDGDQPSLVSAKEISSSQNPANAADEQIPLLTDDEDDRSGEELHDDLHFATGAASEREDTEGDSFSMCIVNDLIDDLIEDFFTSNPHPLRICKVSPPDLNVDLDRFPPSEGA